MLSMYSRFQETLWKWMLRSKVILVELPIYMQNLENFVISDTSGQNGRVSGVCVSVPTKTSRVLHVKISLQAFIDNQGSQQIYIFFLFHYKLFTTGRY